jgi:hypothetical protein
MSTSSTSSTPLFDQLVQLDSMTKEDQKRFWCVMHDLHHGNQKHGLGLVINGPPGSGKAILAKVIAQITPAWTWADEPVGPFFGESCIEHVETPSAGIVGSPAMLDDFMSVRDKGGILQHKTVITEGQHMADTVQRFLGGKNVLISVKHKGQWVVGEWKAGMVFLNATPPPGFFTVNMKKTETPTEDFFHKLIKQEGEAILERIVHEE